MDEDKEKGSKAADRIIPMVKKEGLGLLAGEMETGRLLRIIDRVKTSVWRRGCFDLLLMMTGSKCILQGEISEALKALWVNVLFLN